jgi:hypothetical protein
VYRDDFNFCSFNSPFEVELSDSRLIGELLYPSVPNLVSHLGELQPVSGTNKAGNGCWKNSKAIHKTFLSMQQRHFYILGLVHDVLSQKIRVAFGICAAFASLKEVN